MYVHICMCKLHIHTIELAMSVFIGAKGLYVNCIYILQRCTYTHTHTHTHTHNTHTSSLPKQSTRVGEGSVWGGQVSWKNCFIDLFLNRHLHFHLSFVFPFIHILFQFFTFISIALFSSFIFLYPYLRETGRSFISLISLSLSLSLSYFCNLICVKQGVVLFHSCCGCSTYSYNFYKFIYM